ncbi:sulfatase-like hydrolase/transferase [Maricurvus nonylphenolicus]
MPFCVVAEDGDLVRPNILLLVAEDMSSRVGAFGDPVAITPNLDRLAQAGVRYTNVFTTAGVCAPSRAALITGVSQIAIGAQHMRTSSYPGPAYRSVPPAEVKAFPELLRREGYYTYTDKKLDYQFSGSGSSSGPFTVWNDEGFGTHWRNREGEQPFFGMINFIVTHESGLFPEWHFPKSAAHLMLGLLHSYYRWGEELVVKPEDVLLPPYYPDTPVVRKDIARHYNNIHLMDKQVGEILQVLDEDGLADNTIVIWTTDHGDGLPRAKRELFDSGIKVPLIIRWPERYLPAYVKAGSMDQRLVSFQDLAPTILKLAGVDVPAFMTGNIFAGEALSEEPRYIYAARDRLDEAEDRQRAIRDKQFKYIRNYHAGTPGAMHLAFRDNLDIMQELWRLQTAGELTAEQEKWFTLRPEEELYDIQSDPHELNNLADTPGYVDELVRLRAALDQWLAKTELQADMPESAMAQRYWPNAKQPITPVPDMTFNRAKSLLTINSPTEGASIGYQIDGGPWLIYKKPLKILDAEKVVAKAVRYGWQESDEVLWKM